MTVTPVAWRVKQELDLEEWLESGRKLGLLGRNVPWWIGDWLQYGNHAYGERYVRAARITGYDTQTLMNMVYVASHFAPARRRGNLSWSHHAEVVALDPAEQDLWLDRAEAERLSVRCLRQEIRAHVRGSAAEEQPALEGPSEATTSLRARRARGTPGGCLPFVRASAERRRARRRRLLSGAPRTGGVLHRVDPPAHMPSPNVGRP